MTTLRDPWRAAATTVALLAVLAYLFVELRGVAFGGRAAPQRVSPAELRSTGSGSSSFLYWSHGSFGK